MPPLRARLRIFRRGGLYGRPWGSSDSCKPPHIAATAPLKGSPGCAGGGMRACRPTVRCVRRGSCGNWRCHAGGRLPPLRVRWNIRQHPVGVDVLIDPCRASGLVPADGQWPPLRVRWNIRQHPVGVDALIDPCRASGLAAATKKTPPDGSVFLLEPYSCSSAMTLSMRR